MTNNEIEIFPGKSFPQNDPLSLVGFSPFPKRGKKQAPKGYIKHRNRNGGKYRYYYYCRGSAPEEPLGTAEDILAAHLAYKSEGG